MKKIKPPFTKETAKEKVQVAENAWNSKNPELVSQAYSLDSKWRNRDLFFEGRKSIKEFLNNKWKHESYYKLKKYLWTYTENRISVRFEYEWFNKEENQWYRTHGNEQWQFDKDGLMEYRDMSANDIKINKSELKFIKI